MSIENLPDLIIIVVLIMGLVVGFKRGLTTELVSALGMIVIIVVAFLLKNPLSQLMYENLPFFGFSFLKGVSVLNIAIYEMIALLVIVSILTIVFKVIVNATKVFEKLLKFTIIFGVPSKIAGAVVGLFENFVLVFVILYVLKMPFFSIKFESALGDKILNNTPVLSGIIDNSLNVVNEFVALKDKYEVVDDPNEFNKETLDLFLKYDVITVPSVDKLIDRGKLKITNVDEVLNKYREKDDAKEE